MSVALRPFGEHDYEAVAALNDAVYPDHRVGAAEWRGLDRLTDEGRFTRRRYVATDALKGTVVGYGIVSQTPWMFHPQKFWLHVMVHPQWRRQAVGTLLFDRLIEGLRSSDVAALWANAREDDRDSLLFLRKRGFIEARRAWEMRLPVARADLTPFLPLVERVAAQGIVITTLAAEREWDPHALWRLYSLIEAVGGDVPFPIRVMPIPFEDFQQWVQFPTTLGDAFFIARLDLHYIGLSNLNRSEGEPEALYAGLTGVRRESRRQGIAAALKVRSIEYARSNGYKTIVTLNDSTNPAMISLNMRLGFRHHTGWVTMVRGALENR